jgi:acyl transferase domain-containing protein
MLHQQGYSVFLEIGAQSTLVEQGRQCIGEESIWLPTLVWDKDDRQSLLESLRALYLHGVDVTWAGFDQGNTRRRIACPTYPFQRQRCWFAAAPSRPMLQKRSEKLL